MDRKVIQLNKTKWTIFLTANDSLSIFTQCIEKLIASIDPKRTEIIYLGNQDPIFLNTFSHFCEKVKINYTYGDDQEHALSMTKGDYVVFLTDHTIVSKNFLVKLTYAMDNADKPDNRVVASSPISNEVANDLGLTPYNLDAVQVGLAKQNVPYTYTLKLSPFCLMVKKDMVVPGFNTREIILNANYQGFLTVSANDIIVFHYPEQLDEAISKTNFPTQDGKLGVLYRIKIDDEYIRDIFIKSLEKTTTFTNNIYVLDDNSKVKLGIFMKEKYGDLWSKVTKYEKLSQPYDEKRDYNTLIKWAEDDKCNWILTLEADEVVENKVDFDYIKRYLNPVNPEVFGYKVNHYYFYDSDTLVRMDVPWGRMNDVRFARLFPGKRITKPGLVAGQCGYVPMLPEESVRDTGIRIKNYGYVKSEHRAAKQDFFEKLGVKSNTNQAVDFSYLTKINGMHRYPWVENNTVTFYTPTKSGGDVLWRWLDSIGYLADEMLVGNDSSSLKPEDVELIKSYLNARVIPTVMADNFAEGRNLVIQEAKSDWIFQLDIDEYIEDLPGVRRILDVPDYHAWMFTIANFQKGGGSIVTETIRLFKNQDGVQYWGRLHETIDKHVRQYAWKVSKSPIKMGHFGYTLQSDEEAYKKMQRYLEINLKQIKEFPMYGLSYYNTALHFLEDNLVEDAIKLLEICSFLQPDFPLCGIELAKSYILKANRWVNSSLSALPNSNDIKKAFSGLQTTLNQIAPKHYIVARGHCMQYFQIHAGEAKWLREHVTAMEKKIEEEKTKMLERRAKGQ